MINKAWRKQPQQTRSRATVSAVLEATIRILDREGPDATTTTRIAQVAGISIGTLYQYFSDREAILDALQDREFERALELMQRVLGNAGEQILAEDVAREVIRGFMSLYAEAPGLHRVLALEGLRVTAAHRVHAFDMRVIGVIRHFLTVSKHPVRRKNVDAAAFVVFQSVRASMLARMLESPAGIDDLALTEELTDMVLRYLVDEPVKKRLERQITRRSGELTRRRQAAR
jgi:AcrR family transcriptional regulator